MTGPTFSVTDEERDLCLTCERETCEGGDPTCNWGRVHLYQPDQEHRKAYMREYERLQRRRERKEQRKRRKGE